MTFNFISLSLHLQVQAHLWSFLLEGYKHKQTRTKRPREVRLKWNPQITNQTHGVVLIVEIWQPFTAFPMEDYATCWRLPQPLNDRKRVKIIYKKKLFLFILIFFYKSSWGCGQLLCFNLCFFFSFLFLRKKL